MAENEGSKRLRLDKTDWAKIGKSLLLTVVAAVCVAVASFLDNLQSDPLFADKSDLTVMIASTCIPFVVNVLRKIAADNRAKATLSAFLCVVLIGACATGAGNVDRQVSIEGCNDVTFGARMFGSGTLAPPSNAATDQTMDFGTTIEGIPLELALGKSSNGYFMGSSVSIKDCTTVRFMVESMGTDMIGPDPALLLEKIFVPSADPDPFGDRYWSGGSVEEDQ